MDSNAIFTTMSDETTDASLAAPRRERITAVDSFGTTHNAMIEWLPETFKAGGWAGLGAETWIAWEKECPAHYAPTHSGRVTIVSSPQRWTDDEVMVFTCHEVESADDLMPGTFRVIEDDVEDN